MHSAESITCAQIPRAETIARLNDQLRQCGLGGKIMITQGVRALKGYNSVMLAEALAAYDHFDLANDPHGERDFGAMQLLCSPVFWKIDYYFDGQLDYGSPDPSDATVTLRVLTVMLSSEY